MLQLYYKYMTMLRNEIQMKLKGNICYIKNALTR